MLSGGNIILIYNVMSRIYIPPRVTSNGYSVKVASSHSPQDFAHLIGLMLSDVLVFDDGTDELLDAGRVILPRHYYLFEGTRDGVIQYKPYEYDQYRIVVTTYKGIIYSIDSIG